MYLELVFSLQMSSSVVASIHKVGYVFPQVPVAVDLL